MESDRNGVEYRKLKEMKKNESTLPSNAEVNLFLMLRELVTGLYGEMKDFAKKSANETLNEFKIKSLNRVLMPLKEVLKNQPTALFLDVLDDSSLPTNSDVVIILSQYLTAMQKYEDRYFKIDHTRHLKRWNTKEDPIETKKY